MHAPLSHAPIGICICVFECVVFCGLISTIDPIGTGCNNSPSYLWSTEQRGKSTFPVTLVRSRPCRTDIALSCWSGQVTPASARHAARCVIFFCCLRFMETPFLFLPPYFILEAHDGHCTSSGCGKREAQIYWSMGLPE